MTEETLFELALKTPTAERAALLDRACEGTPGDTFGRYTLEQLLGGALLGQKKYADAEPLLLAGYEGMKRREKTIPSLGSTRIPEALDRLIESHTATNKPDQVKKWIAEKARTNSVPKITPAKSAENQ